MRHEKTVIGLLAALTLAGMSTASAQTTTTTTTRPPDSSQFTLTLTPSEVQPGAAIEVMLQSGGALDTRCSGPVTSPGFVAAVQLAFQSHTVHSGSGQVIKEAGDYVATVPCLDGGSVTAKFKILKGATPVPPPSTSPSPPPTRVTPIGPPQTGGGGTARSAG